MKQKNKNLLFFAILTGVFFFIDYLSPTIFPNAEILQRQIYTIALTGVSYWGLYKFWYDKK